MNTKEFLDSIPEKPEQKLSVLRHAWGAFRKIMTVFPKVLGFYLGLCGLWGFSCFILEESIQCAQFSGWQSIPCEEWSLAKRSADTMETARTTLVFINHCGGQINPLAYASYVAYASASREYIDALRARIFANAPELFKGEIVSFSFNPVEMEPGNGFFILKNGKISVLSMTEKIPQQVTGKIQVSEGKVIIDLRKKS